MLRFATWNVGHAVASRKPFPEQWEWFEENVGAQLVVLTEARDKFDACDDGWSFVRRAGGIGGRRPWGTAIGSFGGSLVDVTDGVEGNGGFSVDHTWPGYVTIADLVDDEEDNEVLLTIVGVHAPLLGVDGRKLKSGEESVPQILRDLEGLFDSDRGQSLIIAGDFNLHPRWMPESIYERFIDVIEETSEVRDGLVGCVGCSMGDDCGHIWTHRNGNSPNAAAQNIDYVFISEGLADLVSGAGGGPDVFPEIWTISDHAPVIVDFDRDDDGSGD